MVKLGMDDVNGSPAGNVSGRGGLRGLDCANNPGDLRTVIEAMRRWPKRWRGQTPEMKDAIVADVDAGRRRAREIMDGAQNPEIALTAIDRINTAARVHAVIEGQVQADEQQAEGGKKINATKRVVIMVADASGNTRRVGSLRELYEQHPAPLPAPDRVPERPVEAQGGDGGSARG